MKPDLDFEVLEWASTTEVLKVRVYGTKNGEPFDEVMNLWEPMTISEVHAVIAKANSGVKRS